MLALACASYAGSGLHIPRPVADAGIISLYLPIERALVPTLADIPVPIAIVPALLFLFASFVIAGTRRLHGRLQFGHALSFALVSLGVAFCATWGTLERSRTDVRTLLSYSAARVTDARRVAYVRLAIARASALQSAVSTATNEFEDGATSERETLRLIGAPSDIALVRLKKFHAPFSGLSKLGWKAYRCAIAVGSNKCSAIFTSAYLQISSNRMRLPRLRRDDVTTAPTSADVGDESQ
jgi:hypothetical protein